MQEVRGIPSIKSAFIQQAVRSGQDRAVAQFDSALASVANPTSPIIALCTCRVDDRVFEVNLYALPSSQWKLMTLILRKLLASSTFAISGTLGALTTRLETVAKEQATSALEPQAVSLDFETQDHVLLAGRRDDG